MGVRHTSFSDAASLCAGKSGLFCADAGGALWRFDRKTMMEASVGCAGPGVCDMCMSGDGEKLFSLLGDADSILMSDASTCAPIAVNRCGCNPQNMSLCGNMLAVSGGESGYVYLFSMQTLECIARIPMPGIVCSVLLREEAIYALCMSPEMHSVFVVCQGRRKSVLGLEGMPGCLCLQGENVLIATQRKQYLYSPASGCLIHMRSAPGRARRICMNRGNVFLLDALSETVFISGEGEHWHRLFSGVKDMFSID